MEISHSYEGLSRAYSRARKGTPRFAAFVVSRCGIGERRSRQPLTIVELGAGSGQQTEFVEKQLDAAGIHHFQILAYDKSSAQLDLLNARIKRGELSSRIVPIKADFDGSPLRLETDSVDLVYMAWVLHHLSHQQDVVKDIARITRAGARLFMYQVTIEDLKGHPLDRFFPMKYRYDKLRYPTRTKLRRMFFTAGFTCEKPYPIRNDDPRRVDRDFLDGIRNTSFDSALRIIRDNEPLAFARGVDLVEREVENAERTGHYQLYTHDRRKVFWGIKKPTELM